MPGPVSDSYDPEFGTGARAAAVVEAIDRIRERITRGIRSEDLLPIVGLAMGETQLGGLFESADLDIRVGDVRLTVRELRIIRFCLDRAKESI